MADLGERAEGVPKGENFQFETFPPPRCKPPFSKSETVADINEPYRMPVNSINDKQRRL